MTSHGRKRGDKTSYPICVWSGILDHYHKIGPAIWEFLWLIDAITLEENGVGWVYGKSPFKIDRIVNDLRGASRRTVERNLTRLRDGGYIITEKARYGLVVGVVNSRKIRPRADTPKMAELTPRDAKNGGTDTPKMAELAAKNGGTGDSILNDNAVRQGNKTAAGRSAVWQFLGVEGWKWSAAIREVCENLYQAKNGQTPVELAGACMDGIEALGSRIPPALARRAAELRAQAPAPVAAGEPIPELEAEPWAS